MIPRLQAEASLDTARAVAVGTGSLKDGAGQTIANGWHAIAYPQEARAKQPNVRTIEEIERVGIRVFSPKKRTAT